MGERGPKPGHAYGAAAVTQAIKGVNFPISKQDLIDQYGNQEVEITKGNPVMLSDILEDVTENSFNTSRDLEKAVKDLI